MTRPRTGGRCFIFLTLAGSLLFGQSSITLVAADYGYGQTIHIAPGQVTTLFVSGASTILPTGSTSQRASSLPLPNSLAGFSATITQQTATQPPSTESMPLVSVDQVNKCASGAPVSPDCVLTELTVQVPVDLVVDYGRSSFFVHVTTVAISDGNGVSKSFNVVLVPQNYHILTTCDAVLLNPVVAMFPGGCLNVVTHADGSLVTPSNPAHPQEELVMYAFGLGITSPQVAAGQPSPSPAPTVPLVSLSFAYSGGSSSSLQGSPFVGPVFAGLTPGEVGLYQVNFTVQPPNGVIVGCDGPDQANLRVTLVSNQSPAYDTARICVSASN